MAQIIERAYRYRFYPTADQKEQLSKTFGCCRFTYNYFLALKTSFWREKKKSLYYHAYSSLLRELKNEHPWLKDVSSVSLQQSLRHLDRAFSNFFAKKAKYPKFKKKVYQQRASYMKNSFTYKDGEIQLAKQKEPLNIRWSRRFSGEPTSLTITKESSDKFYISIHVKEEVHPFPFKRGEVGIDLGLTNIITDSRGRVVCNPRLFLKREKARRRRQQAFSRKQKGSENFSKARKALAIAHEKVREQRQDFLHKLSSQLVHENQVIAVETLLVKNMVKNKHLSKAIADVGWATLIRFLEYKCSWYGKELLKVDSFFPSSKLCSHCGYKREELALSTRGWKCPECHKTHDRDENAAKNILARGLQIAQKTLRKERIPWGTRDFKPVESM